jgi:hypothetical protein
MKINHSFQINFLLKMNLIVSIFYLRKIVLNNTSFILYAELSFTLRSIHLCQCSFYKIFVKFRNNKKNVLKIVLIIVNIYKDENKSLNSNQFSLKNDSPHLLENYFAKVKNRNDQILTTSIVESIENARRTYHSLSRVVVPATLHTSLSTLILQDFGKI